MITKNKSKGFLVLGLILAAPLFSQQERGKALSLSQKDAESIVQQFEAKYVDAYNRKDAKAVAELFTDNATEMGTFGTVRQGREDIEKSLEISLAPPANWKTEDTPKGTVAVTQDVIVTQGASVRTEQDTPGKPPSTILYTKVLVRQGGEWRLAAVQYAIPPRSYVRAKPEVKDQ